MESRFLSFLLLISLGIIVIGCEESSTKTSKDYTKLEDYFGKIHLFKLTPKINSIFVLTDKGCMPCNKKFAKKLKQMDKDSSLVLITAKQTSINLSGFDLSSKKNVFNDVYFSNDYPFLRRSKVIYLGDKKIDSVIELNVRELDHQFNVIFKN